MIFVAIGLPLWITSNNTEKKELARLNETVEAIGVALDNEEYRLALMHADNLLPNSNCLDDGTVRQWEVQREYWIDKVIEIAADKGVQLQYPENEMGTVQLDDSTDVKENSSEEVLVESEKEDEIVNISNKESEEAIGEPEVKEKLILIEPGSEYSYMCNEYTLYTATAISDSLIKIECWTKNLSTSKTVSYEYDVGTFKINDKENEFSWMDKESTAFSIVIEDTEKGFLSKKQTAIFTVNNNTSDEYKGSNYNEQIVCYSYQNDDWHLYRMIPLTDNLMKVEVWYRSFAIGEFGYGYDLCVIHIESKTTDFEWINNEHTEIAITLEDSKNWNLKNPTLLTLSIENVNAIYENVQTCIDSKN